MSDDDYAHEPVPDDKTVSGYRIAVVVTGIIIALPAFITGAQTGFAVGFFNGALAVLLGGVILSVVAMATGTVGARTRLSTAMIVRRTFGDLGGKLVVGVLGLSCLGWFGVTAELFGRSMQQILSDYGWNTLPTVAFIAGGGLLMVITTLFGFSALQRLSDITVPLLAVLIGYTAYITLQRYGLKALYTAGSNGTGVGDGVSAIVGGLSIAVTIFPDLCRFSRSARDAQMASALIYGAAMPAVLLLAMIPSIITRKPDLMVIMTALGLGAPALVLLVVKAWATNAGNLYSASLSLGALSSNLRQRLVVAVAGLLGVVFAVTGISEIFIPFLIALGIAIPPIAGIYVADFLLVRRYISDADTSDVPMINYVAFGAWALGIATALVARHGTVTLSGIPSCDAIITAAAAYILIRKTRSGRKQVGSLR